MRSPRQTEAENPSLVDGDLGGGTYELDQQLLLPSRPPVVPASHPTARLVCGRRVRPSWWLDPGDGRPFGRSGSAGGSPASSVAGLSIRPGCPVAVLVLVALGAIGRAVGGRPHCF
jgi:hypothetical protein